MQHNNIQNHVWVDYIACQLTGAAYKSVLAKVSRLRDKRQIAKKVHGAVNRKL